MATLNSISDQTIEGGFDEAWYLSTYPDVASAIANGQVTSAFDHYVTYGKNEGREPRGYGPKSNRFVHVHIPKTAGTSIRGAFLRIRKNVIIADQTFKYDEIKHGSADLITGHIGFARAKECPGNLITILRDPVDRFISYYLHLVRSYEEGTEITTRTTLAKKYSIDEFVFVDDCSDLISDLYNSMTWQLIHETDINARTKYRVSCDTSDSKLLTIAKENLTKFSVVGFQQRMDEAANLLNKTTGIELNIYRENENPRLSPRHDIDIRTIKRIMDWVYLDLEIYKWSLARFSKG